MIRCRPVADDHQPAVTVLTSEKTATARVKMAAHLSLRTDRVGERQREARAVLQVSSERRVNVGEPEGAGGC